MPSRPPRPPRRSASAALSVVLLCVLSAPAFACDTERDRESDHRALLAIRDALRSMPDVESARRVALPYSDAVGTALGTARWAAPWSDTLRAAHERIESFRAEVYASSDAQAVAAAFSSLVRIAPPASAASASGVDAAALGAALPGPDAGIGDSTSRFDPKACSYSTGEIIAIVLGFILGIIPGIILLILLC